MKNNQNEFKVYIRLNGKKDLKPLIIYIDSYDLNSAESYAMFIYMKHRIDHKTVKYNKEWIKGKELKSLSMEVYKIERVY